MGHTTAYYHFMEKSFHHIIRKAKIQIISMIEIFGWEINVDDFS